MWKKDLKDRIQRSFKMASKNKELATPTLWEKETKIIFCDKKIEMGNRPTAFFNKEGWQNIIKIFKECTRREYDRLQMKNKWDQLEKDWKIWKDLKRGSMSLDWDLVKRIIDASDEWWLERIAVLPAAKKFKFCGIELELKSKLNRMFGVVVATGKYACAPSETGFGGTPDNVVATYKLIHSNSPARNSLRSSPPTALSDLVWRLK